MIKINLFVSKKLEDKKVFVTKELVVATVSLSTIIILGFVISYAMRYQLVNYTTSAEQKKQQIQAVSIIVKKVEEYKHQKEGLEKHVQTINSLLAGKSGPVLLLDKLSELTPDQLWLSSLSEQGGRIALKGYSTSPSVISAFLETLQNSKYFQNVKLLKIEATAKNKNEKNAPGDSVSMFDLQFSVNYLVAMQ